MLGSAHIVISESLWYSSARYFLKHDYDYDTIRGSNFTSQYGEPPATWSASG